MSNKTTDYGKFKHIHGNRQINERHVGNLVTAIQNKDLLEYFPLLVNEHMQLIDGQHRLEAARELGLPIWYVEIAGLTLNDVMSINTNSRSWSLRDFIEAYIKMGKTQYQELLNFSEKYGISIYVAARLINGDKRGSELSSGTVIRKGLFELNHLEEATNLVEKVEQLRHFCDDFNPMIDRAFIWALKAALFSPNFDFEQFVAKLRLHQLRLTSRGQVRYYLLEIEDLYNFRNQKHVDIYASAQTEERA